MFSIHADPISNKCFVLVWIHNKIQPPLNWNWNSWFTHLDWRSLKTVRQLSMRQFSTSVREPSMGRFVFVVASVSTTVYIKAHQLYEEKPFLSNFWYSKFVYLSICYTFFLQSRLWLFWMILGSRTVFIWWSFSMLERRRRSRSKINSTIWCQN